MGVSKAVFSSAGQSTSHLVPGVYSRRAVVGTESGVSAGNLAIIGEATGGEPLVMHKITDKAEAQEVLGSGALLEAVVHAFNGSTEYVPQQVYAVRVNAGTQSQAVLTNGQDAVLTLKSADYGAQTNRIKLSLQDGSTAGTRKVTAVYKGQEVIADNIARAAFSLLYAGAGNAATVSVNADGIHLAATNDAGDAIADEAFRFTFDECDTLDALVARINDTGSYVATLIDTEDGARTSDLDYCNAVDIAGADAVAMSANLAALIKALQSIPFIASVELDAGAGRILPENTAGFLYFSGAHNGGSTVADYAAALRVLETEDVQIIATSATSAAVHHLIADHCISMSSVDNKKERTCWLGMSAGTSIEQAAQEAKELNSEFVSLVATGAIAINAITGEKEAIDPAMLACKCAGIEAAIGVSNPLTNKTVKVAGFSVKHKRKELEALIEAGVVPFGENEEGSLVCIRSITTYQKDSLILNERSMIRSVLYMDRDLRKAFLRRTGTNTAPSESDIIQVLRNKAKGWMRDNLITSADDGSLVFNEKVRFDGDKVYLTFDRYIRAPVNFTFITGTNRVYTSTVEV